MSLRRMHSAPMQQFAPGSGAAGAPSPAENPVSSGSEEQPFFRLDFLRSLQLHRRLFLSFALAGLAMSVGYVAKNWPVYIAQSQVYIQPAPSKVMDQPGNARWAGDAVTYDSFIQQQVQSATHPDVLLSVLHKLGPGRWQGQNETESAAADRLGRAMDVERVETSYQVSITAKAKDAALAADIANAMAASIVERTSREEKAGDAEKLEILRLEKDRIQKELESDRAEQETLNAKLGVAAIGTTTPDHFDDDISRIHEELVKARTDHDQAAARLLSLDANHELSSKALTAESDELIASDPGLISMKTSLNQRRAALITQMANLTPNHPQYKQAAQELAQIDASLESMTKDLRTKAAARIKQKLNTDLDRTAGVEGRLNAQLGKMAGAAASATPKLQRANDLATDIVRLQTRQSSVDEQLHNLMLEDSVPGAAHLSVTAMAPQHATNSGLVRKALPMLLGGILFGILAALIASNLDFKIYVAADVEHVLGFAPMAQLPDFEEVSAGVAEEHLLRLASAIQHARQLGDLKSCLFTGTGPGTGVTTLSGKVKTMLEAMGRSCVLIDASGTPPPPPQSSFGGTASADRYALVTAERSSRSTALLQQLSEQAEEEESLVLTDSAPLLISAETEYLARYVDAAIVVLESGVTTRTQLRKAADTLQRLNVGAVGFVLNRVGLKTADPAFRESVHAIEKRLRAQNRRSARRSEGNQSPAPAAAPKAPQAARETASPALSEPKAATRPAPVAKAAARPAPHAIPELPAAPPQPVQARVPHMQREERFTRPEPMPNFRSRQVVEPKQETVRAERPRTPEPWLPETPAEPQHFVAPPVPVAPQPAVVPPAPVVPQPVAAPLPVAPSAPQSSAPEPWKPVRRLADLEQQLAQSAEAEETIPNTAHRISDLRNLAFSLGVKNLHKTPEAPVQAPEAPQPAEPAQAPPAYRSYPPPPVNPVRREPAAQAQTAAPAPTLVTAQPEFLPPKSAAEEEKEQAKSSKSGHRDRWDADDDMDTLPSWHGQYKKR